MTTYRFGDVVKEVKAKVDRENNPYDFYLAGEHFDSSRLKIPRRGTFAGSDVGPAFHRLFKSGQVLYGSRRTYLKKVAVADFDGVTANTTFVLETKDDSVFMQELLPFVMLSEAFTAHSVGRSKGSTNPYVLFSDLADFKFDLPDRPTQEKLAQILRESECLKELYRDLLDANDDLVKSRFIEMFGNPDPDQTKLPVVTIGELATDVRYGTAKKAADEGEYKYLRMNNMSDDGHLTLDDLKFISLEGDELENCLVQKGDLLFNRTNSREKVGKTCVFTEDEPMVIAGYIVRVRLDQRVRSEYVSEFLNSGYGKALLRKMAKGAVGQANISATDMKGIRIPLPPVEAQDAFLVFAEQIDKSGFCFALFPYAWKS